jgi:hypothetical protein
MYSTLMYPSHISQMTKVALPPGCVPCLAWVGLPGAMPVGCRGRGVIEILGCCSSLAAGFLLLALCLTYHNHEQPLKHTTRMH